MNNEQEETRLCENYWEQYVLDLCSCMTDIEDDGLTDIQTKNIVSKILNSDQLWQVIDSMVMEMIEEEVK